MDSVRKGFRLKFLADIVFAPSGPADDLDARRVSWRLELRIGPGSLT
jgi:hypothetical protein